MCFDPKAEEEKKKKEKEKVEYTLGSNDLPDAPEIARAERTGLKPGEVPFDDEGVQCPICGKFAETFYYDCDHEIFGCDQCVTTKPSWEYAQDKNE